MIRTRTAILISGRGSNMSALITAANAAELPRGDCARGLRSPRRRRTRACEGRRCCDGCRRVARRRGAPTFEAELDHGCGRRHVEVVCLAGFMRILSADFVNRWRDRIINIHPSLLPALSGARHACARDRCGRARSRGDGALCERRGGCWAHRGAGGRTRAAGRYSGGARCTSASGRASSLSRGAAAGCAEDTAARSSNFGLAHRTALILRDCANSTATWSSTAEQHSAPPISSNSSVT